MLTSPIAITNTHSVGVVRDALIAYEVQRTQRLELGSSLPVVAETYDGWLNDINGMHVKPEHVWAALDAAAAGPVAEGCVGGGTGMICHEFKGGIGTSSRVLPESRWRLDGRGARAGELRCASLASHRRRAGRRVDSLFRGAWIPRRAATPRAAGSRVMARSSSSSRPTRRCCRTSASGWHNAPPSVWLASAASAPTPPATSFWPSPPATAVCLERKRRLLRLPPAGWLPTTRMTPLFEACAEATEEAILNALCMATTTVGIDGLTTHALPLRRVREICST